MSTLSTTKKETKCDRKQSNNLNFTRKGKYSWNYGSTPNSHIVILMVVGGHVFSSRFGIHTINFPMFMCVGYKREAGGHSFVSFILFNLYEVGAKPCVPCLKLSTHLNSSLTTHFLNFPNPTLNSVHCSHLSIIHSHFTSSPHHDRKTSHV